MGYIGIVLLALVARYMKIEETRSSKLDLDWRGGIALIIFIVSLMLFLGDLSSNTALFISGASWATRLHKWAAYNSLCRS